MSAAPIPDDEGQRLHRLQELLILDSAPERLFDELALLASQLCGTPIALLSLVDAERQWFKANVGLPGVNETPRDQAFCAHAILGPELMEVPDATLDPRFADNPLVLGDPGIRFYAGVPVEALNGQRMGTLCVIDRQPRRLDEAQAMALRSLGRVVAEALVMRQALIASGAAAADREADARSSHLRLREAHFRALVDGQAELISLARPDGELVYVNEAYVHHIGRQRDELLGTNLYDMIPSAQRETVRRRIQQAIQSGSVVESENSLLLPGGRELTMAWTNTLQRDIDGQPLLQSVGRDVTAQRLVESALLDSETRLARTEAVAHVGGWELDLRTEVLYWSAQTRRIHKVPPDYEPKLATAIAFYAPEARPLIDSAVRLAIETGVGWDLELQLIDAEGQRIWVRAQGEVDRQDGVPRRLVGALQDISERRAALQAMQTLNAIFDATTDLIVQADRRGQISYLNPAARQAMGLVSEQPLAGLTTTQFNTAQTNALFASTIVPEVQERGWWRGEATVCLAGGRELAVSHLVIGHRGVDGRIERYSAVMRDISVEAEAKRALEQQSATLSAVIEAIPALVAVVDGAGHFARVNLAFERFSGLRRADLVGCPFEAVVGPQTDEQGVSRLNRVMTGEAMAYGHRLTDGKSERHLWVSLMPLRLSDGPVQGFVVLAQDVTQQRQEEVRLSQLAQRDALTGLFNRAGLQQFLEYRQSQPGSGDLALLMIDLDHFKPVNDQHGHPVGDLLLQQVAQRLQGLVRPTDAVARLGGDEFAIVLAGVREIDPAVRVADKLIDAMSRPFELGTLRVGIGASVGVALGAHKGWDEVMARADAQLYAAKQAGRGRMASEPVGLADS